MGYARKDVEKTKKIAKKFVRYQEGAELYSIGLTKFQELAKEAKAVYSSMIKHRAQDKNERGLSVMEKLKLDFYYGSDNIEEDLNVSRKTASSPLKELEEIGLIDMIQQTGVANIIYVKNFVSERDQEVRNQCKPESKCKRETGVKSKPVEKVHQCKNSTGEKTTPVEKSNQCSFEPGTSGKITLVPGEKFHPSNIEIDNNINNNSINQSYQSIDKIDVMDETAAYMELIRENIDYDIVMQDYEWKHVFCKPFLHKIAKSFCRLLHLHFVGNCKTTAGSYSASHKPLQIIFSCYNTRYGNGSSEFSSSCACSLK